MARIALLRHCGGRRFSLQLCVIVQLTFLLISAKRPKSVPHRQVRIPRDREQGFHGMVNTIPRQREQRSAGS